jgi:dihydroorotase
MNVLITNGRILDPSQNLDRSGDLFIREGVIAPAARGKDIPDGTRTIDANGLVVVPGFIDLHTHLREPGQEHKETIESGTRAAVRGGFTAVCAMANTVPPNDERAVTEMVLAEARRHGHCRVYPVGAVSKELKGEALAELADLRAAGCVAVSDDGRPVYNAQLMRRALEYTRMLGIPVVAHEEDSDLNEGGVMHEGYYSTLLGLSGIPAASEETMVARDVILAGHTGGHLHIAHISTRGAIETIRAARARGVRVTCEATPHHLVLTDAEVQSFSTNVKMNPPLRPEEHRQVLLEALADGTIDVVATDHAPHHFDEKNVEFDLAPFGITGLETAFAVLHDRLVTKKVITLKRLVELMSCAPARVFSLPGGTLREGSPGDVTIIDPGGVQVAGDYVSRASNSPFTGMELKGRVVATIVGGAVRYLDESHGAAPKETGKAARKKR